MASLTTTRRRSRSAGKLHAGSLALGIALGVLAAIVSMRLSAPASEADVERYRTVRDFVRESFVREVSDEELLEHSLHGMLAGIDAYSRYYDSAEAKRLDRETIGRYVGVGAVFRPPVRAAQVLFCLPGSPAAKAGVRVGDRFESIDGRDVHSLTEDELRASLSSASEAPLEVVVVGLEGDRRSLSIEPQSLVDPTLRHTRIIDAERGIGYISLLSFSRETPAEFERAFEFLEQRGMRALVLDLRRNFGGVLVSAVKIAERFIPAGVIVSTEGRGKPVISRVDPARATRAGFPLAVLVDGDSASASEVLAGALQDHRVAVVIGAPTYGKGMVQSMRHFDEPDGVAKVTSAYYYSPSGRNFEHTSQPNRDHGIIPDVFVETSEQERGRVHSFLTRYGPPLEAIPALERWEADLGVELIEALPADDQLQAALELFAGQRPQAHVSLNDE